jgi:hypothetical protein
VNGPDGQPAGDGGWWRRLARGFARGRRWPRLRAPGRDGAAGAFLAGVPGCREFVEDLAGGGGGDLPPLHDLADGRQERAFAVSQKGVEDGTFWSAKASDYLRGYFHAAALARYDLRAVAAWVSGADPDVPERILAAAGARQWACTLAELRSEAHKTAATVRMVMSRSLAFMADPALAASVLPGPGDGFDIPAFLDRTGTVYLIAEAVSEDAPVAPLFAAMAAEIH